MYSYYFYLLKEKNMRLLFLLTAAGADYDSSEDKDFDVTKLDPKLLKKLKKVS
jgi:hypothetical protein